MSLSPRIGETALIVATPVDANGIRVQGVICTFMSLDTTVMTVESSGLVHGVGAGMADVAVQCGEKTGRVRIVVRLTVESEAAMGTYRLTQANGGAVPRFLGYFLAGNVDKGAEVYYKAALLSLKWDSTTAHAVVSYSDSTMYHSTDPIQGDQIWFDLHSYAGTWSVANGDLSMTFSAPPGFKLSRPRVAGPVITLSLPNTGGFGKAADSVALTLTRLP